MKHIQTLFFILCAQSAYALTPIVDQDQHVHINSSIENSTLATQQLTAPISIGELIDKITILQIKLKKIRDPQKLQHVFYEAQVLDAAYKLHVPSSPQLLSLIEKLRAVNEKLWAIEDALRAKEALQEFDSEFIELARSVYFTNDERGRLKLQINELTGSKLVEEKQYADY